MVKPKQSELTFVRANLTWVTSPPNSNTSGSRLIISVPFSYFLFIYYLPRCTLPDFTSVSTLASVPFLACCHHNNNKKVEHQSSNRQASSNTNTRSVSPPFTEQQEALLELLLKNRHDNVCMLNDLQWKVLRITRKISICFILNKLNLILFTI